MKLLEKTSGPILGPFWLQNFKIKSFPEQSYAWILSLYVAVTLWEKSEQLHSLTSDWRSPEQPHSRLIFFVTFSSKWSFSSEPLVAIFIFLALSEDVIYLKSNSAWFFEKNLALGFLGPKRAQNEVFQASWKIKMWNVSICCSKLQQRIKWQKIKSNFGKILILRFWCQNGTKL